MALGTRTDPIVLLQILWGEGAERAPGGKAPLVKTK